MTRRVLLLTTPNTYRAPAFAAAAERLGVEAITAVDMPPRLAAAWNQPLGVDFQDVDAAAAAIATFAADRPIDAIVAVDDSGSLLAARASAALGLPHNAPEAGEAARDKQIMRTLLEQAGVPSPPFQCCSTAERLAALLHRVYPEPGPKPFLVERFIPGFEVALEGLLNHGELQVLALFDKPDPLDGPFFEETIYVTPSRLPAETQAAIARCAADAAAALGLREGPMHAELRVNDQGPWIVELAGRSIGGLCSKTLRFGTDATLEELILRQACGMEVASLSRAGAAGGVMMIPIPGTGLLKRVDGLAEAAAVPGVEEIDITAQLNYPIVPLPEGDSYLGFIFARGATPEAVEAALREAHGRLRFRIQPAIPLLSE